MTACQKHFSCQARSDGCHVLSRCCLRCSVPAAAAVRSHTSRYQRREKPKYDANVVHMATQTLSIVCITMSSPSRVSDRQSQDARCSCKCAPMRFKVHHAPLSTPPLFPVPLTSHALLLRACCRVVQPACHYPAIKAALPCQSEPRKG